MRKSKKRGNKTHEEVLGWGGAIAIVLAYALLSFNILNSSSISFHLLNGLGALGIVYGAFKKKDYPPGALNILWALIAIIAILRLIF